MQSTVLTKFMLRSETMQGQRRDFDKPTANQRPNNALQATCEDARA
jgi:hypothetical protein